MLVQAAELLRVELVVEDAAFAADEMRVEVVGLEAIDDRRALADRAVRELQDAWSTLVWYSYGAKIGFALCVA